jgi:Methyltransferase FkbM domain/Dolichyl-phosphate-mannose-protein mannosyltransferase
MKKQQSVWLCALPIAGFALIIRLAYIARAGIAPMVEDSYQYLWIAWNLVDHGAFSQVFVPPYTPTTRRAPLFPAFLALLDWLHLVSPLQIACVQAMIGALGCVLVFLVARRMMADRWAALAACYYAVFPGGVGMIASISAEPLFTLLLLASIFFAAGGIRRNSGWMAACAGAALGLSALCRPISLPLSIVFALIIGFRASRRLAAAFALGAMLTLAPWAIRTSVVSRAWVPIQGYSAANFYMASQWWIDHKDYAAVMRGFERSPYGRALRAAIHPADMARADQLGMALALQNVKADPRAYLQSRLRAWPYLFLTSSGGASFGECWMRGDYAQLGRKLLFMTVFSLLPLALACTGLLRHWRNPTYALCAAVWLFTLLIHFPLWIEYRFWIPAFPFLTICAVAAISKVYERIPKNTMIRHILKHFLPGALKRQIVRQVLGYDDFAPSFSSSGADMVLRQLFHRKSNGFYVDIGAYDPIVGSNTYFFYLTGWRGINIDARPGSMAAFNKLRPRDVNLEIGIAEEAGEMTFHVISDDSSMNSFSPEFLERLGVLSEVRRRIPLHVAPLRDVLSRHVPFGVEIDFFNVDAEGMDYQVLKSNDWERFRPRIVVVEDAGQHASSPILDLMRSYDYQVCAHTVLILNKINEYILIDSNCQESIFGEARHDRQHCDTNA